MIITNGTPKIANPENFFVNPAKTLDVDTKTGWMRHSFCNVHSLQ